MDSQWRAWREDRKHYPSLAWVTHREIWAVAMHRAARGAKSLPRPFWIALAAPVTLLTLMVRICTNIEIAHDARIGPGLHLYHCGMIVHKDACVGRNVMLMAGAVLGADSAGNAPIVEDNARIATYAVVVGDVTIGRGAVVGAHSLVVKDVPPGAVVGGVPAKVIGSRAESA